MSEDTGLRFLKRTSVVYLRTCYNVKATNEPTVAKINLNTQQTLPKKV